MGRGIVLGGLFGLVFAGLVLALVSQLTERRSLSVVAAAQDVVAPGPVQLPVAPEPEPSAPGDPMPVPSQPETSDGPAPADVDDAPQAPSEAPGAPEAPGAEAVLPTPPVVPTVAGAPDAPQAPAPEVAGAGAPVAPATSPPAQTAPAAQPATLAGDVPPLAVPPVGPGPVVGLPGDAPVLSGAAPQEPVPLAPGGESMPPTGAAPTAPVGPGPVVAGLGAGLPGVPAAPGAVPRVPAPQAAPVPGAAALAPATLESEAAPGAPQPVSPTVLAVLAPDLGAPLSSGQGPTAPGAVPRVPALKAAPVPGAAALAPATLESEVAPGAPQPVSPTVLAVLALDLGAPLSSGQGPTAPGQEAGAPDQPQPREPEEGQGDTLLPMPEGAPAAPAPVPEVVTDRLPRIGDRETQPEDAPGDAAPDAPLAADALTRNGVPFETGDGRPMVSVVLLDLGGEPVRLPFPFSVAIDAAAPDAARRAADYRAARVEVVLLAQIPIGAQPSDVSVALEDTFVRIPDAVALLDSPKGELQGSREVTAQVLSELAETGHGLLAFPRGFNTLLQLAEREGVIAGLVFREIDGDGLDLRGIKRFLDQGAFRARQEDSVILIGRNAPETIAALAEWALGNRAASVALVPVSAALKAAAR